MEMAAGYGIEYDPPAGGCLLTDPGYSTRLRILLEVPGLYTPQNAALVTHGRMLVLSDLSVGLVGRDQSDNEALDTLSHGDAYPYRDAHAFGDTYPSAYA